MNVIGKFSAVTAVVFLTACASTSKTEPADVEIYTETPSEASTTIYGDQGTVIDSGTETTTVYSSDPYYGLSNVVYFDYDQSSISYETRSVLDAWASALNVSPRFIRLNGHADERGTREYNIALGERRAQSIADYLISAGVSSSLIETVSYGEERPAVPGTGEGSWSQNRRVELN